VPLHLSFDRFNSFFFDTSVSVDITADPRPIQASLADCCHSIIVLSRTSLLNYFCEISTNVAPLVSLDSTSYRCSFASINTGNITFQIFHSISRQLVFEATAFKQPTFTFQIVPSVASMAGGAFVEIVKLSQSWVPNQCAFGTLLANYSCSGMKCGCTVPQSFESNVVVFQLKSNETSVGNIPFSYARPIRCSEFFPIAVSSDLFFYNCCGAGISS